MKTSTIRALAAVVAVLGALAACDRAKSGASPGEWRTVTVAGMSLAAPGRLLQITTEVPAAMDPRVRAAVLRIDSYGRSVGKAEMRVSRVTYQPGVPLSLQGSAQGAVDAIRANPAVEGFSHTHGPAEVSGIPGIRTSMRFSVRGEPALGEMLTVLRGQTLWQVQAFGPAGAETEAMGKRVMDSAQLQPDSAAAN